LSELKDKVQTVGESETLPEETRLAELKKEIQELQTSKKQIDEEVHQVKKAVEGQLEEKASLESQIGLVTADIEKSKQGQDARKQQAKESATAAEAQKLEIQSKIDQGKSELVSTQQSKAKAEVCFPH